MSRSGGLFSAVNSIVREIERQEKAKERARNKALAQELSENKARIKQQNSLQQTHHLETMLIKTEELNNNLSKTISNFERILEYSLSNSHAIDFDQLLNKDEFRKFSLPADLIILPSEPKIEDYLPKITDARKIFGILPVSKEKQIRNIEILEKEFNIEHDKYLADVENKKSIIKSMKEEHDKEEQKFLKEKEKQNNEMTNFKRNYFNGNRDAIIKYCSLVLENSDYFEVFPKKYRVSYNPEPKEIVVDFDLPTIDVIPEVKEYQYIKSNDEISKIPRKPMEIKNLYKDIVSSICLRTISELIESDINNNLSIISFNGFVQSVNPATGQDIHPCLITIRTTKDYFKEINLNRVDKQVCLRNLGAQVSPQPDELIPVKPIVEFDMIDKRFVSQSDILSDLENRPNLMNLDPFEFENLVSNLFGKIGFDVKQTQTSFDGGVDAIAFDTRPILGGKVVIQAKRYKNTVDVSAVRDLYGTMINEGANKGILVCTSHYGSKEYHFAKDKPIELIDGGGLLYLLEQNGVKAQIIFPNE